MTRTNFDKWKEGLTPEKMLNAVKRIQNFCCVCPAKHSCSAVNNEECNEHIMAWANEPAEEEE